MHPQAHLSHNSGGRAPRRRYGRAVALDVYRSCKNSERRRVLQAFWGRGDETDARIRMAATQYGQWALVCCVVLALEPIPAIIMALGHSGLILGATIATEMVLVSIAWWAAVRMRVLRRAVIRAH